MPEVGQGEQIQRAEVSGLWGTLKIWMMLARVDDKYCSNPRVTWAACGQKESKSPTVTTKNVMTEGKGVCTINNK